MSAVTANDPVLSVRGLRIRASTADSQGSLARTLVDGVGFDLSPGQIVGLVGESGSGKTLTASALLGLAPGAGISVEADALRLAGRDLMSLDERGWRRVRGRDIAMVFQEPLSALDPVFTIGRQLGAVLRRHRGLAGTAAARESAALLAGVGLPDPGDALRRYPHQLSGGQRQRVLMAMALSCGPRVLVADEPTTALDVTTQAQILDLLEERAQASGTAVLLVTHDLAVVRRICSRALVMQAGRIVEEGPVERLMEAPSHPYTAGLLAALPRLATGAAP